MAYSSIAHSFFNIFLDANKFARISNNSLNLFISKTVNAIIFALAIFNLAVGFWNNAIIMPVLMIIVSIMYNNYEKVKYLKGY